MIFQAEGLGQNQNKSGKKKARRGAMIVEKVNKSVRHSHRDIRIDKKKDRSYSRQERPERKEIRNERLGGRRKNRTADEDGRKRIHRKAERNTICTNRVKEDAHAVESGEEKSRGSNGMSQNNCQDVAMPRLRRKSK